MAPPRHISRPREALFGISLSVVSVSVRISNNLWNRGFTSAWNPQISLFIALS
ncbi:hypothetical protein ACRRTK_006782 [Alexandromys fortis]